jgi:hypothetical protein
MKKQIWKFNFPIKDDFQIEMPKGANILTVQNQHERGTLWAICDTEAEKEIRNFSITGTGHPIDPVNKDYIGTFQTSNGSLVWHLFETVKK